MRTSGFSIETFYRNIASISCGGKLPIFENETINPILQLTGFMFGLLPIVGNKEQAPKDLKAMKIISVALAVKNSLWNKQSLQRLSKKIRSTCGYDKFSLDRYLILYSRYRNSMKPNPKVWDYFVIHDLMLYNTRDVATGCHHIYSFSEEILGGRVGENHLVQKCGKVSLSNTSKTQTNNPNRIQRSRQGWQRKSDTAIRGEMLQKCKFL